MSELLNDASLEPGNAGAPGSPDPASPESTSPDGGPAGSYRTTLSHALGDASDLRGLANYRGAEAPVAFSGRDRELKALLQSTAIFDLGYRARIEVRGEDRSRWLNGMLTNNVQGLAPGEGNYNFVLNAQGRIQADCQTFRLADHLLLETDRNQVPALLMHLDHFIIMDDVELCDTSTDWTALGLAGSGAAALLRGLGVHLPSGDGESLAILTASIADIVVEIVLGHSGSEPQFELWFAPQHVLSIWNLLQGAGAEPCGSMAVEALRILHAEPLYGVDLLERDLPQEANQPRALNFTKGCYLGQEIVERIRSRGNVHRRLVQFTLSSMPVQLPAELSARGQAAGRITSATEWNGTVYGLGMARVEALERGVALEYKEGTATPTAGSPVSGSQA
jgi:folate-binding protein YgfZ